MRHPVKTLNDAQRRRMTRSLWEPGSRQLTFDFVPECETRCGPRWLEIEKEKAVPAEPPQQKERKKYDR